jgi:hypothetical protein
MAEVTLMAFCIYDFRQQQWGSFKQNMFMLIRLNLYVGKSTLQAGCLAAKKTPADRPASCQEKVHWPAVWPPRGSLQAQPSFNN